MFGSELRYCPNCDERVTIKAGNNAECERCGITWNGVADQCLPITQMGPAERERQFQAAKQRAGIAG